MEDRPHSWRRIVAALIIFGISFGYVEAAVVDYLRALYNPIRRQLHPERPADDLFPLISLSQLQSAGAMAESRTGDRHFLYSSRVIK